MTWHPIHTAPIDRQFLATDWRPGDPWSSASIELMSGPYKNAGGALVFFNHNSNHYSPVRYWSFWTEKPSEPEVSGDRV